MAGGARCYTASGQPETWPSVALGCASCFMSISLAVVGLGPGAPRALTTGTAELLRAAPLVVLRTARHPALRHLALRGEVRSFDDLCDQADGVEGLCERIVAEVLDLAVEVPGLVYAVPGHPLIGDATVACILRRALEHGIRPVIEPAVSFIDAACAAVQYDPLRGLQVHDALALPPPDRINATVPLLLAPLHDQRMAAAAQAVLAARYPLSHPVQLVPLADSSAPAQPRSVPVGDVGSTAAAWESGNHLTALWVPALAPEQDMRSAVTLREIMAQLRAPDGCPWDRAQTRQTLKRHLLEETYEVLDAIDGDDVAELCEELGDLLLQVYFHAQIAAEDGSFTFADVVGALGEKLVRRHPHVFGDQAADDAQQALANWEQIKQAERRAKGKERSSLLDRVPSSLPALATAQALGERAATVGFDWETVRGVFDKVREELDELRRAETPAERAEELGDVLFVLARVGSWMDVNVEDALRRANRKFRARFGAMEAAARCDGVELASLSADEWDRLWNEAKRTT